MFAVSGTLIALGFAYTYRITLQTGEMVASRSPRADEMDAYERVLGAAMVGETTLFARQDDVEEAWRIVDPVLKKYTPLYEYERNTWGPDEVERVAPPGGWHDPILTTEPTISGQAA